MSSMVGNNTPKGGSRKLVVAVEESVIADAQERSSSHCMIADAIRQQYPDVKHISVDLQTIRFTDAKKGLRYLYLTPPQAQRALVMFDQGIAVEPFEFTLRRAMHVVPSGMGVSAESGKPKRNYAKKTVKVSAPKKASRQSVHATIRGGKLPPNAALTTTRGRVRVFGMAQLKP